MILLFIKQMGKIFINIDFKNVGNSQNNLFDSCIFFYLKSLKIEKLIESRNPFNHFQKYLLLYLIFHPFLILFEHYQ